jgi:hypothetical protein
VTCDPAVKKKGEGSVIEEVHTRGILKAVVVFTL